ncbi:hypothetical protein I79_000132 [Cricetulus griseus]|uniref:Uncharacterized protein n=1 Tax=Cricetulus griseus TaxID=10029 RepID=G3GRI5_CRIGR|nr:hypothetical protein I79_000132 [Cricetulus griseus]
MLSQPLSLQPFFFLLQTLCPTVPGTFPLVFFSAVKNWRYCSIAVPTLQFSCFGNNGSEFL